MSKQIKFFDKESRNVHGGILLDNGDVLCGCCGGLIPNDEIADTIRIMDVFPTWISLDEEICGDWFGEEVDDNEGGVYFNAFLR